MGDMPYVSENLEYIEVPEDHPVMDGAMTKASVSTCYKQRTGAVIVDTGQHDTYFQPEGNLDAVFPRYPRIVASGNNEVVTPQTECPRMEMPSGTGYELCEEACGGNLHAEVAACKQLNELESDPVGEWHLYLYGHWWCCESCCDAMKAAGITKVHLVEGCDETTEWFSNESA